LSVHVRYAIRQPGVGADSVQRSEERTPLLEDSSDLLATPDSVGLKGRPGRLDTLAKRTRIARELRPSGMEGLFDNEINQILQRALLFTGQ
jgi:hypothetical protein